MPIQVQIKVLPNPSGEVVRVSAGGMNLVGGTEMDTTVVEIEAGKKFEIEGEIEERVVYNPAEFAATRVPLSDVDGSRSFAKEKEEKDKLVAEEDKKIKEDLDKKFKEAKQREDQRLGRPKEDDGGKAYGPTGGDRVAGNVVGSKEVRDDGTHDTHPPNKPKK
jgi:hypothetical protein